MLRKMALGKEPTKGFPLAALFCHGPVVGDGRSGLGPEVALAHNPRLKALQIEGRCQVAANLIMAQRVQGARPYQHAQDGGDGTQVCERFGRRVSSPDHVLGHAGLSDIDAELEELSC
jgi:hypothetical protein